MTFDEDSFQILLQDVVENALVKVLGKKVANALQFYVDLKSALKNPDNFVDVISQLIGRKQAMDLRRAILLDLYAKHGQSYSSVENVSFIQEIKELKSRIR